MKRAAIALAAALTLAPGGTAHAAPPVPALAVTASTEVGPAAGSDLTVVGPHPITSLTEPSAATPDAVGDVDYLLPADVEGRLPAVTMIAGFGDSRASVRWLAERLASYGVLVQLVDPVTSLDPPSARARTLTQAHAHLTASSPVRDHVDAARLGLWGYSMGGGGALRAATELSGLRAVVAVFPWDPAPSYPTITAPTLVVAGERDGVALKEWYALPAYTSLTVADRAYAELADATHPLPSHSTDPRLAQVTVAWFLDHLGVQEAAADAHAVLCPGPVVGAPLGATSGYSAYRTGPLTCE